MCDFGDQYCDDNITYDTWTNIKAKNNYYIISISLQQFHSNKSHHNLNDIFLHSALLPS